MSYVLIHNNRVILGPIGWSQTYFTNILKIRHKIEANIPGSEPEKFPYIINENTSIHKVIENKPEINTLTQYHYGPLWDTSNDIVIANYEIKEIELETAKNNFKLLTAAERYKKEISGVKTTVQNLEVTLDTSREGRNVFIQKLLIMSDDEIVNWKFPEGWLTINKSELASIVKDGAAHIQKSFDWEKELNEQIESCLTLDDLLNLDIIEN